MKLIRRRRTAVSCGSMLLLLIAAGCEPRPAAIATAPQDWFVDATEQVGLDCPIHLPEGERPRNVHVFFSIYFCLTGLHGIHVLAGMIMLAWLFWGGLKGKYNKDYFTPVDLGGLYWHLVDLVWIYLFPLLYLIS